MTEPDDVWFSYPSLKQLGRPTSSRLLDPSPGVIMERHTTLVDDDGNETEVCERSTGDVEGYHHRVDLAGRGQCSEAQRV